MKKILAIMFVLLLAVPAVTYAGSVGSRWDLTIGGDVKFDAGWSDQSGAESGNAMWVGGNPDRNPASGNTKIYDKYGTQLWGGGETGLNFFVKGPDAWGAKTHAFILTDFTGFWGAAQFTSGPPANYNEMDLLIAEVGLDWAHTSVTFGVSGSFFGEEATWANSVGWNTANFGGKGAAPVVPQATITEKFDKNWSAGFGILEPYNTINQQMSPGGSSDATAANMLRSPIPAVEGKIAYTSDSCGKIGPWQLLFEADGFWGEVRSIYGSNLSKSDNSEWIGDFKVIVPIIPEKNGNKTGALLLDGEIFMSQGAGQVGSFDANAGGGWLTAYFNDRNDPGDFVSPILWGIYTHGQYYLTDAVSFNGYFTWSSSNPSNALIHSSFAVSPFVNGGEGAITNAQQYIANIMYDVNPALRFTLEWDYTNEHYVPPMPGFKSNGSNDAYRLAAYYFF